MEKISLREIYKIFFIIGAQLIGGGYVILPLLKKYIAEERKWLSEEELIDYFAVSQCIPGIIAGNIAIFSGYKARKGLGALAAITGLITPPFLCILILAHILTNFTNNEIVQEAFWGIRISVIVLIIITVKDMWTKSVNSKFTYTLFSIVLIFLLTMKISPAVIIILSALSALLYSKIKGNKNA